MPSVVIAVGKTRVRPIGPRVAGWAPARAHGHDGHTGQHARVGAALGQYLGERAAGVTGLAVASTVAFTRRVVPIQKSATQ